MSKSDFIERLLIGDATIVQRGANSTWQGRVDTVCTIALKSSNKRKAVEVVVHIPLNVLNFLDAMEIVKRTMPAQVDTLIDGIRAYTSIMVNDAVSEYVEAAAGADL